MKRSEAYDEETLGELFRLTGQDLLQKNLAERLFDLFQDLLGLVVESISAKGSMDVSLLMNCEEYQYIFNILESSSLYRQVDSVNNVA
jgi:hypothetical protein